MRGFRLGRCGRDGRRGGCLGLTLLIGVAVLFVASLEPQEASARRRLFGRRGNSQASSTSQQSYGSRGGSIGGSPQAVANYKAGVMASQNRMRHIGGGYGGANAEGVGAGRTAQQALNNCCFTNRRPLVASAVKRGSSGTFYACKLFR